MCLFIWLFICIPHDVFSTKLVNISKGSLSPASPYSTRSNLQKGLWEFPVYSQLVRIMGDNLGDLCLASEVTGSLVGELVGVGKAPHAWGQMCCE